MPGGHQRPNRGPSGFTTVGDRGGSAVGQQNADLSGSTVYATGRNAMVAGRNAIRIGSVRLSVGNLAAILIFALLVVGGGSAATVAAMEREPASAASPRQGAPDAVATASVHANATTTEQAAPQRAQLSLSTTDVRIGDTYQAVFTGYQPGERVLLFWTGRSNGTIGTFTVDATGRGGVRVREGAEPGDYLIHATGESSRRTASAALRVTPAG